MSITLTADDQLIERARAAAEAQGVSLDELLRRYMEQLAARPTQRQAAERFTKAATGHDCRLPQGWKLNRDAIHRRGEPR